MIKEIKNEHIVEKAESADRLPGEIVPVISKTSELVQEIVATSDKQSAGVSQRSAE